MHENAYFWYMSEHILKRHNKTLLMYHLVFPLKYRRKAITAREIFKRHPEVKEKLWGGKFWTSGYYANTVGQYGNEDFIRKYVEDQGKTYEKIFEGQLKLF